MTSATKSTSANVSSSFALGDSHAMSMELMQMSVSTTRSNHTLSTTANVKRRTGLRASRSQYDLLPNSSRSLGALPLRCFALAGLLSFSDDSDWPSCVSRLTSSGFTSPSPLEGWWGLGEGTGDVAVDVAAEPAPSAPPRFFLEAVLNSLSEKLFLASTSPLSSLRRRAASASSLAFSRSLSRSCSICSRCSWKLESRIAMKRFITR
mmetsp:Transcript_24163/g.82448  ORF Transcript_24163/g.82448 Transcript_24163/m.82448 type:complete len:207 (-) Transcript_24163:1993-2613(-)